MVYEIEVSGCLDITPRLEEKDRIFLQNLANTRRMARNLPDFGVEGEYYVRGTGHRGQDRDETIIDYNRPPATQPSLWLDFCPDREGEKLVWNGEPSSHHYKEWLFYLLENIFGNYFQHKYLLNGCFFWQGEEEVDSGLLKVVNNHLEIVPTCLIKKSSSFSNFRRKVSLTLSSYSQKTDRESMSKDKRSKSLSNLYSSDDPPHSPVLRSFQSQNNLLS